MPCCYYLRNSTVSKREKTRKLDIRRSHHIHVHTTVSDPTDRHRLSCLSYMHADYQGRDGTLGDLGMVKHGPDTLGSDDNGLLSSTVAPLGFPPSDSLYMDDGYVAVHSDNFSHEPSSGLLRANELVHPSTQQSAPYVVHVTAYTSAPSIRVRIMHATRYSTALGL